MLDQRRCKDFILGFNIVGADTRPVNNKFNRMEKAKMPCWKSAESVYDDAQVCREVYVETLNYV